MQSDTNVRNLCITFNFCFVNVKCYYSEKTLKSETFSKRTKIW